ncbi:MAG: MBL fold metallo-hydrolase [Anaerolineae bacterium]|jgi:glyoxylase-like metal-dependent hydrolase (beta-lactamase superfamily II)|nr:MBL fold metallo-hydrolase [Anaerolineae bacterium]MBT7073784.1 MBL fold metallo-hydrolase [Anaerolineae bacterium]MBT7783102.1 MBL fold metallo-hydrolase [Anaerolineae bacterium]
MTIHIINTFSCNSRFPKKWKTGLLSYLIESKQGLLLVDTGLSTAEYDTPSLFTQSFRIATEMPFNPQESALIQVQKMGYKAEDIKHIILTHAHFDHISGITDFPQAQIHLYRKEYDAFIGKRRHFFDLAYDKNYIAHKPDFQLYDDTGDKWFEFDAICLPFSPEIWLIPLVGHSRGHCGVAIQREEGWFLHCGDAAGDFRKNIPAWAIRLALGPHEPRLRAFGERHPDITLTSSHMFLDFFEGNKNE